MFKDRTYSTGVFLMTTLGFVLYGSLVLLPIMLQTLLEYPSLQAGIAMANRWKLDGSPQACSVPPAGIAGAPHLLAPHGAWSGGHEQK